MTFIRNFVRWRMHLLCLFAASLAFLAGCDRTQDIYEVRNQAVPRFAPPLNLKHVEGGIKRAANSQRWRLRRMKPGQLEATKRWRSHVAVVKINYSPDAYDILFARSENLLEGGGQIHRRFNQFVHQLDAEISEQLSLNPSETFSPTADNPPAETTYVRIPPKSGDSYSRRAIAPANGSEARDGILLKEPEVGAIPWQGVVYVDDGSCPKGQIKKLMGGSESWNTDHDRECVSRYLVPPK